ncbi:hypothetical protein L7F22_016024 [Adiantum nelumboides]|nr:hypothetical protein [Adiantum nelumboides]
MQSELQGCNVLDPDDVIAGVFEEITYVAMMSELEEIKQNRLQNGTEFVKVHSMNAYEMLLQLNQDFEDANEDAIDVQVETKYKTVAKKVKPLATPLPEGSNEVIEEASRQPTLRDPKNIGHKFTEETLKQLKIGEDGFLTNEEVKCFQEILMQHGKAFAFEPSEIGSVDPSVVSPMIIFTVPHMPWSLRPIPVPKAHLPKLIDLLNEKIKWASWNRLVHPILIVGLLSRRKMAL